MWRIRVASSTARLGGFRGRFIAAVLLVAWCGSAVGQAFTENFDDITTLSGNGWVTLNNSSPVGSIPNWFQGNPTSAGGPFDAYNGAGNAYIAANYNFTSGANTINGWMLTPNRTLRNGDVLSFYTRKAAGAPEYPDRLEVRMSTNGASTNVGAPGNNVGDFTTLLLSVNPTLVAGVYPQVWTLYTITLSGLPAPTSGRVAFRYFVTNGGLNGSNSDYIGIDNVVYTPYVCPTFTMGPESLVDGTWGQAYSTSLSQSGALGAPSFMVSAGALPPGLTLSASGTLSGTPSASGTYNFTVNVADASGCSGSKSYSLTVDQASQTLAFPAQTVASRWFYPGDTFAIDPEATSAEPNSGAPVVHSSLDTNVCTVSGTTVTMVAAGTCEIAADQAGDADYLPAPQVTSQVELLVPTEADLWVDKDADRATARIGDTVAYSIVLGNDGPADANDVAVLDSPPDRLEPGSVVWECTSAVGTDCPSPDSDTGGLDLTLPNLPRNAVVTFELLGVVREAADPELDFTAFDNTATVALPQDAGLTDPQDNNTSSASVLVIPFGVFKDGFEQPQP